MLRLPLKRARRGAKAPHGSARHLRELTRTLRDVTPAARGEAHPPPKDSPASHGGAGSPPSRGFQGTSLRKRHTQTRACANTHTDAQTYELTRQADTHSQQAKTPAGKQASKHARKQASTHARTHARTQASKQASKHASASCRAGGRCGLGLPPVRVF